MDTTLRGRVAIVTGASSGIGAAVCQRLAGAGCRVALAARRERHLTELAARLETAGGTVMSVPTDVTKHSAHRQVLRF